MSTCKIEPLVISSARINSENPTPDIKNVSYIRAKIEVTNNVSDESKKYIGSGMISTLLPYKMQDDYDRSRHDKVYKSVVLENNYLKATFLPELGGRLWSLFDKTAQCELLYRNPVFQPCNLALRNAWFSGGIEFNVGIKGHNPLTCSPLFAQKIVMEDGSVGVRMYEYERIRSVAYGIDAWLPDDSKLLYIRPRIENKTNNKIWTYWWSNIAVPETDKTRVIVPSDNTLINYFGNDHYILDSSKMPYALDTDISYPKNIKRSLDFFYIIPDNSNKWIAAVREDGYGLLQCSTKDMKGRKLFVWGQNNGGKNWKKYLSDGKNNGYIEIQAGLARTQLEHIPMESGSVWSCVEVYGAINGNPNDFHNDWNKAQNAVNEIICNFFGQNINAYLEKNRTLNAQAEDLFCLGSGWGALENQSRKKEGNMPLSSVFEFPLSTLGQEQYEWMLLLDKNEFLCQDTDETPKSYITDKIWLNRLENAIRNNENKHWYSYMHLGVMQYANGLVDEAKNSFEKSLEYKPNVWSYRNLAMIWKNEYCNDDKAFEYMEKAVKCNCSYRAILLDAATIYINTNHADAWIKLFNTLENRFKTDGRMKFNYALALMKKEKYIEAANIIKAGLVVPDIKEGDTLFSDVWEELYENVIRIKTGETNKKKLEMLVEQQYPLGELDYRTH